MRSIILLSSVIALSISIIWAYKTDFKQEEPLIAVASSMVALLGIFAYQKTSKQNNVRVSGIGNSVNVDTGNKKENDGTNNVEVSDYFNNVNVDTITNDKKL